MFFAILTAAVLALPLGCHTAQVMQTGNSRLKFDSTKVQITLQQRKAFKFNGNQIVFTNRFSGARLNSVVQQNDSTFVLTILSENSPINPSPWYAFKVWSAGKRNVYLTLRYPTAKHRYNPKISYNGQQWRSVDDVALTPSQHDASFRLNISQDTLTVAAQEVISTLDSYTWMDSLAALPFMAKEVVGHSLLSKPIMQLHNKESNGKKIIAVLSRQHPPEVTGYMAMQEFVRTLTGDSPQARAFRQHYKLVIYPMLNPDGVEEGNWRHSAAGVDLNRDWENFVQPETQAVKNDMQKMVKEQQAKVYFAIDFHSTFYDVFYINQLSNSSASNAPGLTEKWLQAMKKEIPGFEPNIKPSGNGGNVSKSWFSRELGAEALTYEVGDATSRSQLKLKGRIAAEKLMVLLKTL